MKIPNRFARVLMAALMVIGLGALAGCGSDTEDGSASVNKDAKTVVVATRGTVKPYSYTDASSSCRRMMMRRNPSTISRARR